MCIECVGVKQFLLSTFQAICFRRGRIRVSSFWDNHNRNEEDNHSDMNGIVRAMTIRGFVGC